MADAPRPDDTRPPLGSWARLYLLVVAAHVVMLLLLWWLSAAFNLRLPAGS